MIGSKGVSTASINAMIVDCPVLNKEARLLLVDGHQHLDLRRLLSHKTRPVLDLGTYLGSSFVE